MRAASATRRVFSRVSRRVRAIWRISPPPMRIVLALGALVVVWAVSNWTYQVIRKPTELFFPVSGALSKSPAETWRDYGPIFREHSTQTITPPFLAALAQVEASGNPIARTYWHWRLTVNPFTWYQPASSAVGMYQITDGTFVEARRYCVHDHVVAHTGRWDDVHACWFNALYTRVVPSHAVEMTAALLDVAVARVLAERRGPAIPVARQQDLAAVIHLCGEGGGEAFVRRGFKSGNARCGDQNVAAYVARVNAMKREFTTLSLR
jgi:hypothetical protein